METIQTNELRRYPRINQRPGVGDATFMIAYLVLFYIISTPTFVDHAMVCKVAAFTLIAYEFMLGLFITLEVISALRLKAMKQPLACLLSKPSMLTKSNLIIITFIPASIYFSPHSSILFNVLTVSGCYLMLGIYLLYRINLNHWNRCVNS